MKKSIWRKGIVLVIVVLFIGASVISSNVSMRENKNVHSIVNQNEKSIIQAWWDYDWNCRRNITINHNYIDTPLSNFPVLVVINSTIGAKCDDGNSIRFLSTDNTIEYNYEIELWNTSGDSYVWVNVTSISNTADTTFLMYYNNSVASDNQNPSGVWDSHYLAVWHFHDANANIADSTKYGRDSLSVGGNPTYQQTGKAGYCIDFDGTGDYFVIPENFSIFLNGDFTIETLVNTDATDHGTLNFIIDFRGENDHAIGYVDTGGDDVFKYGFRKHPDSTWYYLNMLHNPNIDTWYNLVIAYDNDGDAQAYVDGSATSNCNACSIDTIDMTSSIAEHFSGTSPQGYEWDGKIDEIRVSNINRNTSWISASFHTQNQTTGFITFGNEELANYPPIADFTYTPTNPIQTDIIQFTDTSIDPDGNITTWSWDFGDGNTSTLQNPTHIYGDWGTYTVTLNVTDDGGKTDETSQLIFVANSEPTAYFTYTPPNPKANETIYFTDASTDIDGIIVSWFWDFDDGYSSSLQNPTHQYPDEGSYNVTLTVTDDDGANDTYTENIVVLTLPNNPPYNPTIDGPTRGKAGVEYTYCVINATDPDGDDLWANFSWGDGTYSGWIGPNASGEDICATHTWWRGNYEIKAKLKDEWGLESPWSDPLPITIPRNKPFNFNFNLLSWLFERFPNALPILRHMLGI